MDHVWMTVHHLYSQKSSLSESSAGMLVKYRNGYIGIRLARTPASVHFGLKFKAIDNFAGIHAQ